MFLFGDVRKRGLVPGVFFAVIVVTLDTHTRTTKHDRVQCIGHVLCSSGCFLGSVGTTFTEDLSVDTRQHFLKGVDEVFVLVDTLVFHDEVSHANTGLTGLAEKRLFVINISVEGLVLHFFAHGYSSF
ncbi:hypothetical protein FDI85_gp050 [Erwinia phage Machina]|uniref:Uncharacterized protein n=1 Tax=Erwinia phage Machina TaxID=1883375 RepID=A0A1B2IF56_9CAUD|nr:hypothetical protein FDI85_gp050 [Erwinia phage Machina]ANZ49872.1 hypothetical protein MACHINA_234 [Erwinia phage Machina]